MRQIIAGVILPLDEHDWLKWSQRMTCLVDRDVSNGSDGDAWTNVVMVSVLASCLIAASLCLHCVNCRINPNHKPCALKLRPKPVVPNL